MDGILKDCAPRGGEGLHVKDFRVLHTAASHIAAAEQTLPPHPDSINHLCHIFPTTTAAG